MNKHNSILSTLVLMSAVAEPPTGGAPAPAPATVPPVTNGDKVTDIVRNEIITPFFPAKFKRGEAKKSGKTYPFPVDWEKKNPDPKALGPDGVTPVGEYVISTQEIIQFLGEAEARGMLLADYALFCQNWACEATPTKKVKKQQGTLADGTPKFIEVDEPTGEPMNVDEFSKYATSFSARGESMATLMEKMQSISLELPSVKDPLELQKKIQELSAISLAIQEKKKASEESAAEAK